MAKKSEQGGALADWLDRVIANGEANAGELAEKIEVSPATLSRWRRGHVRPSAESCFKIGQVLGEDPMRVLATAGYMEGAGVEPLPTPKPLDVNREEVRRQLSRIKGLTRRERQRVLEAYDGSARSEPH